VEIEREPAHRLVLQNEHVRAFEILLPPGQATLWHVHRHDGVSVRLSDSTIQDQPEDGAPETLRLRRAAIAYGAMPTVLTHRVRNVGEVPFHNVYVELLMPARAAAPENLAASGSDRPADFENPRVRVFRRTLAPGAATVMHTHPLRGVGVVVSAGRLEISDRVGAPRIVDVEVGAVQWIEPGTTHALKNVGERTVEIVDVELK
jgi:quercetin dioxygenase-like cupin family protein